MKDKLGRKIKDYDLVLGMIVSRDSDGMRYGVINGKNIYWDNGIKSVCRNLYLIEHPNEKELEIKNKILKVIEKDIKLNNEKKNIKYLKANDYKIGHIYETSEGVEFAYLGKGNIWLDSYTHRGRENKELEGFLYYVIDNFSVTSLKSIEDNKNYYLIKSFSATKSRKRFVKDTGKIFDIVENPCVIYSSWENNYNEYYERAVIELYG